MYLRKLKIYKIHVWDNMIQQFKKSYTFQFQFQGMMKKRMLELQSLRFQFLPLRRDSPHNPLHKDIHSRPHKVNSLRNTDARRGTKKACFQRSRVDRGSRPGKLGPRELKWWEIWWRPFRKKWEVFSCGKFETFEDLLSWWALRSEWFFRVHFNGFYTNF